MSTEWTTERLNNLPEGTVIEWRDSGVELTAVKQEKGRWHLVRYTAYEYPEGIIEDADPGSIRVVSVPIEALLAEGAVDAVFDVLDKDGHNGYDCRPERPADVTAEAAIRAAVAHITGNPHPEF